MKKILIIEDNEFIRENTALILQHEDYEVLTAGSYRAGLQKLQTWLLDLILCDVMMPEGDGFEVLEQVRQNPITADIPFVFLTAITSEENKSRALEKGATDYLTKPYTDIELLAALTRNLKAETPKKA